MLILPTTPPIAIAEASTTNQAQNQQMQNVEQSRKATDTVQVSARAREIAGSDLNNKPAANSEPAAVQKTADNDVAVRRADHAVADQQRPSNPTTNKPATTKIDIVA